VAACGAGRDYGLSLQYQYYGGQEKARGFIADILDTFSLADIDEEGFREALNSGMADFEDAVQYVGTVVTCRRPGTRRITATGPTCLIPPS